MEEIILTFTADTVAEWVTTQSKNYRKCLLFGSAEILSTSIRMAGCRQHLLYPVREWNVKRKENKNDQKVNSVGKPILRLDIRITERHCTLEKSQNGSFGTSHAVSMRLLQILCQHKPLCMWQCPQKSGEKENTLWSSQSSSGGRKQWRSTS